MTTNSVREIAADLAADAALLEIAENVGVSTLLDGEAPFSLAEVTALASVPEAGARSFLGALVAAGLLDPAGEDSFTPCADMADRRYAAGYLSWSLTANRPYLDHAAEFLREPDAVAGRYSRDGRSVAISSRWIGSAGFYPGQVAEILSRKPQRIVDLGSGAGGLLIQLLTALPTSTGLALDMSAGACEAAEQAAELAGVSDRLTMVNRPIESLLEHPEPVQGADVVHAGFVMHDTAARPEVLEGILRTCREGLAEGGSVIVTDCVPYAQDPRERAFSALFTYLHAASMEVNLPTETEWRAAFTRAGFGDVTLTPLPMPGSRLIIASR